MYRTPKLCVSLGAGTIALLGTLLVGGVGGTQPACAATIYVRTTGNDANDGAVPVSAVRSIAHAAALATPGDRIVVGPGTYAEGNIAPVAFGQVSFVADRRGIEVDESPGDVIVNASGFIAGFVLNHNIAVSIDGFVIYGAAIGIYVKSQSHQATISNNIISQCSHDGVYVQDSDNAVVFNNLIYSHGNYGILITGNTLGSPSARVINNTVYGNGSRGIFFAGTRITSPGGVVLNNAVQANRIAGIQVNAGSRANYISAGNVSADRFAHGTPIDVTDRNDDPQFVNPAGADGMLGGANYADDDFHLAQKAARQETTSPAVDVGSGQARLFNLNRATTRTDGEPDSGWVDAGFHYRNFAAVPPRPDVVIRSAPLYVAPTNGQDSNDGRSPSGALQTLARAFQLARPGDQIWMQPGVYREGDLSVANSGTPQRPIVIQGMPGAQIDATGHTRGILLAGRSNVTLNSLDISGAADGVELRNGSASIEVRRCHLHQNAMRGLYVNGAAQVLVRSSILESNGTRGVEVDGSEVAIDRSIIGSNAEQGLWAINGSSVAVTATSFTDNQKSGVLAWQSELSISDSSISGGSQGGARFTLGSTGTLTRVTVTGSSDAGIQGISSLVSVTDSTVENNTRVGIEGIVDVATNESNDLSITRSRVCSNQGPGVHMQDTGATLTDVTICQNGLEGLRQENGSLQLQGGAVAQNGSKGITVTGADEVTIQDVQVTANKDNGVQVVTANQLSITGATTGMNAGDGITVLDAPGPEISNNLVYGNAATGISISGNVTGSPNAQVLNNTVYGSGDRGVLIGGGNAKPLSAGAVVLRNIFQGNVTAGLQVSELSIPGFTGDYNLSIDPYGALTQAGMHDVFADPLFVAPTAATPDFHLSQRPAGQQATSPAVDAGGVDVTAAGLQGTSTRTDGVPDTGAVDLGFHYSILTPTPSTPEPTNIPPTPTSTPASTTATRAPLPPTLTNTTGSPPSTDTLVAPNPTPAK